MPLRGSSEAPMRRSTPLRGAGKLVYELYRLTEEEIKLVEDGWHAPLSSALQTECASSQKFAIIKMASCVDVF